MTKKIEEFESLAEKFKAIGHPTRIAILNLLCTGGCSRMMVKNIYKKLKLDQPSVSRHLNIMRKSGVLKRVQEKGNTFYCLCLDDNQVNCFKNCFS